MQAPETAEKADEAVVKVQPTRGRTTAWEVRCSEHGRFPGQPPKKNTAIRVGIDHLDGEHNGKGSVRVRKIA